jgi:outer membrane receptor for ferrienterochelin and colicin
MIAEFRTTSANLNAEFGGAAGGVVNLVTRTGVNQWHGDATFFTQNEALNARNP